MPWAIRLRGNKTTECMLFLREASWYCCRQDRIRTCITLTSWCELFYYVRWGNCPLTNIDNPSPLISASTIPPPDPDSNRWKHHLSVQQNPDPKVVIVSSQDRSWTCVHQIQLFDYVTTTPPDYTFFCLLLDYKRKTSSNLNLLTNPSSCTEQENGEVLFLLLCSQDRIRTCTITRPLY